MRKYSDAIQDRAGNALAGAAVYVTLSNGDVPTLYAGDGVSPYATNVLATNANGEFSFYAADGRYNITVIRGSIVVVRLDVEIVDAAVFASRLTTCETFDHYITGSSPQRVIITPDGNGDLTADLPQDIGLDSDVTHRDVTVRHLASKIAAPTVSAYGAAAGTSPTVAISGDASVFDLDITPGSAPAAGAVALATFVFQAPYAAAPKVSVEGNNRATRALMASVTSSPNVEPGNITTGGFVFSGGTNAIGSSAYSFRFRVWGK